MSSVSNNIVGGMVAVAVSFCVTKLLLWRRDQLERHERERGQGPNDLRFQISNFKAHTDEGEAARCGQQALPGLRERMLEIWKPIANRDPGFARGDFLTAFAQAMVRADHENFEVLLPAALELMRKYRLPLAAARCGQHALPSE
jgi:hypothetical protein